MERLSGEAEEHREHLDDVVVAGFVTSATVAPKWRERVVVQRHGRVCTV